MPLGIQNQLKTCNLSSLVIAWWVASVVLIAGCGSPRDLESVYAELEQEIAWHAAVPLPPVEEAPENTSADSRDAKTTGQTALNESAERTEPSAKGYWGFSDDSRLISLPAATSADASPESESATSAPPVLAFLLPPQAPPDFDDFTPTITEVETSDSTVEAPITPITLPPPHVPTPPASERMAVNQNHSDEFRTEFAALPVTDQNPPTTEPFVLPTPNDLSLEERQLLEFVARESSAAATGVPTDARLDAKARKKIGEAFALAQRGASFAAHRELIEVLRMVSQAKDAKEQLHIRSNALAAGLRALEEAEDFAPRGTQLEAELDLKVICGSHRTPIARQQNVDRMIPRQMMDRYYRYAQLKLALAVAGEPAGSMALYTLGKLSSQLGSLEPDKHRMASRRAVAYQQAALLAHSENYLAAHELGVLLAETGHLPEAQNLLLQVARQQPNAVVYRNLARVQEELGYVAQAEAFREEATRLAQSGSGNPAAVEWVSPHAFSHRDGMQTGSTPTSFTQPMGGVQVAQHTGAQPPAVPTPRPPGTSPTRR